MSRLSRRTFLARSLASSAAVAGAGLWSRTALAQSGDVLRVTHFGGPYQALDALVGKKFTDGKVAFDQDQPALIFSKWQAQPTNPPYDIGLMVRPFTIRAFAAGLVTPLTAAEVPGIGRLVPGALAPDNAGAALAVDSLDIMYDRSAVSAPITSWLDLWRPEFKGKLTLPAMPLGGAITYLLVSVARAMGGDENKIDDAITKFKDLKGNVRSFYKDPNLATQMLERGEVVVAPQYSARIGQLMKRAPKIARGIPKEGVPAIPYDFVIAKGSKQQAMAKKFVNFVLTPGVQADVCSNILLTPAITGVSLPEDVRKLIVADSSKLFAPNEPLMLTKQAGWLERWQREIES